MSKDWVDDKKLSFDEKLAIFETLEAVTVERPQKVTLVSAPEGFTYSGTSGSDLRVA